MPVNPGRLFVGIAAYRDPELPATIRSLIHHAQRPECLRICVTLQTVPEPQETTGAKENLGDNVGFDAVENLLLERLALPTSKQDPGDASVENARWSLKGIGIELVSSDEWRRSRGKASLTILCAGRIAVLRLHAENARGPYYARALHQNLIRNMWKPGNRPGFLEDTYLQLDSHMRFSHHWDQTLATQLKILQLNHKKPILTSYPPPYPQGLEATDHPKDELAALPTLLCASEIMEAPTRDKGLLRIKGRRLRCLSEPVELPSLFWAAGLSFSGAALLLEAPYDPRLLHYTFMGEEHLQWIVMRRNGWRFFAPTKTVVWHLWKKAEARPCIRDDNVILTKLNPLRLPLNVDDHLCEDRATELGVTIAEIRQFWEEAGINAAEGHLSQFSLDGGLRRNSASSAWEFREENSVQSLLADVSEQLHPEVAKYFSN